MFITTMHMFTCYNLTTTILLEGVNDDDPKKKKKRVYFPSSYHPSIAFFCA